ncbi:MAG: ferrochelatase [Woeseiaceae bacterium]|nr:ferrochelatase [Woeseiaceae bacterium]
MPRYFSEPRYEHGTPESLGVLLVNLGTPDAPTTAAVRRYLKQFLSDPRVVELPRPLWWLILNGVILRIRPARTAAAYAKIWTDDGSPLLLHCRDIASGVAEQLSSRLSGAVHVELAMSYGQPSIADALDRLHKQYVRRVVVLPLYPQYSNTTTGSVFADVTGTLARRRWIPELRFINHYHDAPGYIAALTSSIRDFRDREGTGERLLFSFHGLPRRMLDDGDPYHCQCQKTARLVAAELELADDEWRVSFQSRVGREPWLKPYTDELLEEWGAEHRGDIDVVCPGFAADCLETLEEIRLQNAELYAAAGGGKLRYVPALNARDDHVAFLSRLVAKNASGWPEASPDWSHAEAARELDRSLRRARRLGAEN